MLTGMCGVSISLAADAGLKTDPTFNVVMVYEDVPTGSRAMKTYGHIVDQIGREVAFNNEMWKFDALRQPEVKELAAAQAAQADMIIISAHGNRELPQAVRSWIDLWLTRQRTGARALVELSDTASESSSRATASHSYLKQVAEEGQMDFFSHSFDAP